MLSYGCSSEVLTSAYGFIYMYLFLGVALGWGTEAIAPGGDWSSPRAHLMRRPTGPDAVMASAAARCLASTMN